MYVASVVNCITIYCAYFFYYELRGYEAFEKPSCSTRILSLKMADGTETSSERGKNKHIYDPQICIICWSLIFYKIGVHGDRLLQNVYCSCFSWFVRHPRAYSHTDLKITFIIFALGALRTLRSIVYVVIFIKFISYPCTALCAPFLFLSFIKKRGWDRKTDGTFWKEMSVQVERFQIYLYVIVVCKLVCPSLHCKPKYLNSFSNSLEALYG